MSSSERTVGSAVDAASDGRHVDIVGPRLSGRSSLLRHVVDQLRDQGRDILEVWGRTPPAELSLFDAEHDVIAVDDWDHLALETRAVLRSDGATLITTRVGGSPASTEMHSVVIPRLDAEALRVLLTRVVGIVLDRDDALALSTLTDGAAGAAIGITNTARENGALTVTDGRGALDGYWLAHAGPVVENILEPLNDERKDALAGLAQSAVVRGVSGDAFDDLVAHGYLEVLPEESARVSSTLLRRWFTRF